MDKDEYDRMMALNRDVQEQGAKIHAEMLRDVLTPLLPKAPELPKDMPSEESLQQLQAREMRQRERMQKEQFRVGLISSAMNGLLTTNPDMDDEKIAKRAISVADAIIKLL